MVSISDEKCHNNALGVYCPPYVTHGHWRVHFPCAGSDTSMVRHVQVTYSATSTLLIKGSPVYGSNSTPTKFNKLFHVNKYFCVFLFLAFKLSLNFVKETISQDSVSQATTSNIPCLLGSEMSLAHQI